MTAVPSAGRSQAPGRDAEAERDLVVRAQAGDAAAYEELVRKHQSRVFAVANGILQRREDVEDIAQQVFIKAYLALKRFDRRSTFSTWLYKITVNECWDYLRKKKVRPLLYEADLSEEQANKLEVLERDPDVVPDAARRAELRQAVDWLLGRLPQEEQLMLVLKEVQGYSVEEIGEMLGLNVNTVKVRLFRARGRLVEAYRRKKSRRP